MHVCVYVYICKHILNPPAPWGHRAGGGQVAVCSMAFLLFCGLVACSPAVGCLAVCRWLFGSLLLAVPCPQPKNILNITCDVLNKP